MVFLYSSSLKNLQEQSGTQQHETRSGRRFGPKTDETTRNESQLLSRQKRKKLKEKDNVTCRKPKKKKNINYTFVLFLFLF